MPKSPNASELDIAYRDLSDREEKIVRLTKELHEYIKVEEIIVAAGLLPKEKFEQARDILRSVA